MIVVGECDYTGVPDSMLVIHTVLGCVVMGMSFFWPGASAYRAWRVNAPLTFTLVLGIIHLSFNPTLSNCRWAATIYKLITTVVMNCGRTDAACMLATGKVFRHRALAGMAALIVVLWWCRPQEKPPAVPEKSPEVAPKVVVVVPEKSPPPTCQEVPRPHPHHDGPSYTFSNCSTAIGTLTGNLTIRLDDDRHQDRRRVDIPNMDDVAEKYTAVKRE